MNRVSDEPNIDINRLIARVQEQVGQELTQVIMRQGVQMVVKDEIIANQQAEILALRGQIESLNGQKKPETAKSRKS